MKRTLATALFIAAAVSLTSAQQQSIDQFFESFVVEWVRGHPNLAASTRMFTGEEQRQLERQITPLTPEWRRGRVALAQRALNDLNAITERGGLTVEPADLGRPHALAARHPHPRRPLQRLLLPLRTVRRRQRRADQSDDGQPPGHHRVRRRELRRPARTDCAASRRSGRRSRARRGAGIDSAALHHPRDGDADAAVRRVAAAGESAGRVVRGPHGGGPGHP